jgi:SNF2-related domain/Helicase conserved C-terminal domain
LTAGLLTPAFRRIPFQLDGIARAYVMRSALVVWDMGTGKSALGNALAALALSDGETDLVIIACEKVKLADWEEELRRFTEISSILVYHGPQRHRKLAAGLPQVMISTYETLGRDLVTAQTPRKLRDGELMGRLRGHRVMVIYDESTKLGNRSSRLYRAQEYMLRELRKENPGMRVYGATGTPIERDWENAFNQLRLIVPGFMTVSFFEKEYTNGQDDYRRYFYRRANMPDFAQRCAPHMIRKRKTDPDVIDQFPPQSEEFIRLDMKEDQRQLYRMIEDLAWEGGEHREISGLLTVLRQVAGHPVSLRHAQGALGQMLWEELQSQLLACSSAKTEYLKELARQITAQGSKALVFTFFGQSVLRELARELEGFQLFQNHGGMASAAQMDARQEFLEYPGPALMLSSDSGKRGVNIPVPYVIEYEAALTHSDRQQRFGRASRIGHNSGPLTCITLTLNGTVEAKGLIQRSFERNQQQEILLGDLPDEHSLTSAQRRILFSCARKRTA